MHLKSTTLLIALVAWTATACTRVEGPGFASQPRVLANRATEPPPAPPSIEAPRPVAASEPVALDPLSDGLITMRVRGSLVADPALAGADISVNTDRGVVSLAGSVTSQEQAAIATAHAQRYDGVMRIDNHLSVSAR